MQKVAPTYATPFPRDETQWDELTSSDAVRREGKQVLQGIAGGSGGVGCSPTPTQVEFVCAGLAACVAALPGSIMDALHQNILNRTPGVPKVHPELLHGICNKVTAKRLKKDILMALQEGTSVTTDQKVATVKLVLLNADKHTRDSIRQALKVSFWNKVELQLVLRRGLAAVHSLWQCGLPADALSEGCIEVVFELQDVPGAPLLLG